VIGVRYYSSKVGGLKDRRNLLNKIKSGQVARMNAAKTHLPPELYWLFSSIKTDVGHTGTRRFINLLVGKINNITSNASDALVTNSKNMILKFMQSDAKSITLSNSIDFLKFH
jgi:hypothetical protein